MGFSDAEEKWESFRQLNDVFNLSVNIGRKRSDCTLYRMGSLHMKRTSHSCCIFFHFGDSQLCLHVGISCFFLHLEYGAMQPCLLVALESIYIDLSSGVRFDITYHFGGPSHKCTGAQKANIDLNKI